MKRGGVKQPVNLNKITQRLYKLKNSVDQFRSSLFTDYEPLNINVVKIARSTVAQMYNGITTSELDTFAADISAYITDDPDYPLFAGNLLVSNLEADNKDCLPFAGYVGKCFHYVDEDTGTSHPLISQEVYDVGIKYGHLIDKKMVMQRNFMYDYFAMKTLIKGRYLLTSYKTVQKNRVKTKEMVAFETPQHMWMRVAIGINGSNLDAAFELYDIMSLQYATHATPTLFNSGTKLNQMSSCFLLDMKEDSLDGIYDTLKQCAIISKFAGGIGLSVNKIRCKGSYIGSTHGSSNGVVPMLKVFNSTARYCDQGGGKRKGSFAIYMSPYHADVFEWLDLKKNTGAEDARSRDLFYALWISDVFMERVILDFKKTSEDPVMWSLLDPNTVEGLDEVYGDDFRMMYEEAEEKGHFVRQVPIRDLWYKILESQIESGTPYMLFKDHCNNKSNHKNIGTIHSSNLCAEILEHTSKDEVAVCNLASISLPSFVMGGEFDYAKLYEVTRVMVRNLDRVIDRNFYPVPETRVSNSRHRPIGLGIQGLANVFCKMKLPFDSSDSMVINRRIAETMYFAALTESHALAVELGAYSTIDINGGAPVRHGIFQQDMWDGDHEPDKVLCWDWSSLRTAVKKDGVRNSLLIAHMPTASTSQILGNTESFEPYYANIFSRKTKAGEFFCYNSYMIKDLQQLGLWKTEVDPTTNNEYIPMKDKIIEHHGSIQKIMEIPEEIRNRYRTLMDIPLKNLTLMARDRCVYVDQSCSLNVHHRNSNNMMVPMTKYLCYAWKLGLKTGSYYTRTIQDIGTIDFAGSSEGVGRGVRKNVKNKVYVCTDEVCTSCSG